MTAFGPVAVERTNTRRVRLVETVRDPGKWEAERVLLELAPSEAFALGAALLDMAEAAQPDLTDRRERIAR